VRTFTANHEIGTGQNHLNAYGREGEPCNNCKHSKIKKIKVGGRGTHFCPTCQKL
jgi:formamidopyrimidine-DNA glycosylase